MAFKRPSIATLKKYFRSDAETETQSTYSWLRRSLMAALSKAVVGVAHGLHGHIQYSAKQVIPGYATDEAVIERQATLYLKQGRKAAVGAKGNVDLIGTDGKILPAGSVLQRAGFDYVTDADATIVAGVATVAVTATVEIDGAGQDTNASEGTTLTLTVPVAGINSNATVATGDLTGGTDQETFDQVNQRIRERIAKNPNGSNNDQYEVWAREVAGVTRAWSYSNWMGYGTVGLFFVRDDDASLIPDAAEVQTVQDYIDVLRPSGMKGFSAIAPTEVVQNFDIQLSPNTAAVQAAVESAIKALFLREAKVEDGSGNATMLISHIREVISSSTDEQDHVLVSPATNITLNAGELLTVGAFTWSVL